MAFSRDFPLIRWIEAEPAKAFAAFALVHAVVWTALPTLLYLNLPLDLIEGLVYGREWQLGYDKLPPLPWWLVDIASRVVGHDVAFYLMAQIAVLAAFAAVWATGRGLVGNAAAMVGMLIIDGLHYLNYTADKFNHDVIQLPFWALAGFALHRGLRGGALRHWLLLGLALGMALWAKYFVVILVAPMALFLLIDREARKAWATPGPYVAAAAALVVMAPHLVWLARHHFLPFAYAEQRALLTRGPLDHVWHPLQFAGGQLYFLLPSLLIALPLFLPRGKKGEPAPNAADAFDRRILAWLALGPAATMLALSALTGRGTVAMWGYPLWLFLGIWLVQMARRSLDEKRLARSVHVWGVVFAGLALAFVANYTVLPRYDHRYRAVFFPGEALALELAQRYRAVTGQPIVYVIGNIWNGGNIEHYAPSHPRLLVDGDPDRAPWIDLADLKARGALVLWTAGDLRAIPPALRTIAGEAAVQPPLSLPYLRGDARLDVGWAVLAPRPSYATAITPPKPPP